MQDSNRNEQPWYYFWLALIGAIVVAVGACYVLYLGGYYIWLQGYDSATYKMNYQLEEHQEMSKSLESSFYLSVKALRAVHDDPDHFSRDGKCDLQILNKDLYEFMDTGVRFGEYVSEFERNSAGQITGLKEPVHINKFNARTR